VYAMFRRATAPLTLPFVRIVAAVAPAAAVRGERYASAQMAHLDSER